VTTYCDTLINVSATRPANHPMIDPQVTQRILTQSKQVLVNVDSTSTKDISLASIRELAIEITAGLEPPAELLITIEEVTCL